MDFAQLAISRIKQPDWDYVCFLDQACWDLLKTEESLACQGTLPLACIIIELMELMECMALFIFQIVLVPIGLMNEKSFIFEIDPVQIFS